MSQTTEIVAHVVSGVVHSLRVSLYREWGVPYPWLRKSPMVRFKTDRAWPQPSPISDKMPPAVLHVPAEEKQEFLAQIVSRFQRQVTYSWLAAITYLKGTPHLDCPDDATFTRHLTHSVYSYFLTRELDDADLRLLAAHGIDARSVWKSDLSPVSTVEAFPGLHCAGSVCYFREVSPAEFEVLGIAMVDRDFQPGALILPTDGSAWKLAKVHALQGATYLSLFVTHPRCHFPMDAIIAVTRTCLPETHRVWKLLDPHMYLQVPLDYSVLHIKNGPGYNDPRLYYTAFSGGGRSQYRLFEYSFAGMAGHAAFPPYHFGFLLERERNAYLEFMAGYHQVILAFVREVLADMELDDAVREWAKQCAHYSRGFGPADGVLDKEQLAFRVATIMWNCSVVHSADHWEFYGIPMEHKPTRLRVPPPFEKRGQTFDAAALTHVEDRLRQYMWHELYVRPWPLRKLTDVDYGFEEPALQQANRGFADALAAYDKNLAGHGFIPLAEIATSIQY
jgi:hypothetical protein